MTQPLSLSYLLRGSLTAAAAEDAERRIAEVVRHCGEATLRGTFGEVTIAVWPGGPWLARLTLRCSGTGAVIALDVPTREIPTGLMRLLDAAKAGEP